MISFLIYSISKSPNENLTSSAISKTEKESEQNPSQNTQSSDTTSSSPASSGGGGGGGGGESGGSDGGSSGGSSSSGGISAAAISPTCTTEQISYSLYKFNKIQTCLNYQDGICTEKKVVCSVNAQNLDYTTSGMFQVNFILKEISTQQIIQQESLQAALSPGQETEFKKTFEITSPDAEKELTCDIFTEKVPTKTVC